MQMKYGEQAKQNGVFVVSACGWDSVPCLFLMFRIKLNKVFR
jgi:short subunit dehydrogenase-like uncharacterized protein